MGWNNCPLGKGFTGCRRRLGDFFEEVCVGSQAGQFGDGLDAEPAGEVGPMQLHGALIDAEFGGDLLIEETADDETKDLKFARGERREATAQERQVVALLTLFGITSDCALDCREELIARRGFGEEILRAAAHRLDSGGNIALASEKDDGKGIVRLGQGGLELEAIQARHSQIGHNAAGNLGRKPREKGLPGLERFDLIATGAKGPGEGAQECAVVIHDKNRAGTHVPLTGKVKRKVAPPSGLFSPRPTLWCF